MRPPSARTWDGRRLNPTTSTVTSTTVSARTGGRRRRSHPRAPDTICRFLRCLASRPPGFLVWMAAGINARALDTAGFIALLLHLSGPSRSGRSSREAAAAAWISNPGLVIQADSRADVAEDGSSLRLASQKVHGQARTNDPDKIERGVLRGHFLQQATSPQRTTAPGLGAPPLPARQISRHGSVASAPAGGCSYSGAFSPIASPLSAFPIRSASGTAPSRRRIVRASSSRLRAPSASPLAMYIRPYSSSISAWS